MFSYKEVIMIMLQLLLLPTQQEWQIRYVHIHVPTLTDHQVYSILVVVFFMECLTLRWSSTQQKNEFYWKLTLRYFQKDKILLFDFCDFLNRFLGTLNFVPLHSFL